MSARRTGITANPSGSSGVTHVDAKTAVHAARNAPTSALAFPIRDATAARSFGHSLEPHLLGVEPLGRCRKIVGTGNEAFVRDLGGLEFLGDGGDIALVGRHAELAGAAVAVDPGCLSA
jgi:hypothetical protein